MTIANRSKRVRIATRRSALAMWQAEHARDLLQDAFPKLRVELVPMVTEGDRRLSGSLAEIGGKGLFVKELEAALLTDKADIAVHSMKDVPARLPEDLCLSAFLPAENPCDAFVSQRYNSIDALPQSARVGTASLRRQAQLLALRPDLDIIPVRGNVGTRLRKIDEGEVDALLLAHAGLARLGLAERITESLDVQRFVPSVAQGVIGIECRSDDRQTRRFLVALDDHEAGLRLAAERTLSAQLGGACTVPVAGHSWLEEDRLHLIGLVASPDGKRVVRGKVEGGRSAGHKLGNKLADQLLAAGARDILRELGIQV